MPDGHPLVDLVKVLAGALVPAKELPARWWSSARGHLGVGAGYTLPVTTSATSRDTGPALARSAEQR